jgi:hypothetical protein
MTDADDRRKRNDPTGASALRRAADALDETKARLRQTGAELRERERELDRTSHLVRDVARTTRELRPTKGPPAEAAPPSQPGEDATP